MTQYYILVKKTGAKDYLGAIPTKRGATRASLNLILKRLRKGYSGKIVTRPELVRIVKKKASGKTRKQVTKKK